jgi:hypothetical protein
VRDASDERRDQEVRAEGVDGIERAETSTSAADADLLLGLAERGREQRGRVGGVRPPGNET